MTLVKSGFAIHGCVHKDTQCAISERQVLEMKRRPYGPNETNNRYLSRKDGAPCDCAWHRANLLQSTPPELCVSILSTIPDSCTKSTSPQKHHVEPDSLVLTSVKRCYELLNKIAIMRPSILYELKPKWLLAEKLGWGMDRYFHPPG